MKVIGTALREGPDYVSRVGLSDELPAMIGEADVGGGTAADSGNHAPFRREDVRAHEEDRVLHQCGSGRQRGDDDLVAALNAGTIEARPRCH